MQHFVECVLERRVKSEPENVTHIQSPPNIATKERPPKKISSRNKNLDSLATLMLEKLSRTFTVLD